MNELSFLEAVGKTDPAYLDECIRERHAETGQTWVRRIAAAAACLVLVLTAVLIVTRQTAAPVSVESGFQVENGVLVCYTGTDTDLTIPDSVKEISDFAFVSNENASEIRTVRLGANVETIGPNALAGLDGLEELVLAETNQAFREKDGLLLSSDGSLLVRYERTGETAFTLPESVRYVGAHAVQGTELEEIRFGSHLEYVGYNAFSSNYRLKAIYLPDSLRVVCEGGFSDCGAAVDGSVPASAVLGEDAFRGVPFYLTLKAGQMCPGEEIVRGLITPSEAVLKSKWNVLQEQILYVLTVAEGNAAYEPSETAMLAYGAVSTMPTVPEGLQIPRVLSPEDLTFQDNGWGSTGLYDLQIIADAGEYRIVMEAYGYGLFEELYWENARFRIASVFFLREESSSEDTWTEHGWTVTAEKEGDYYTDLTFVHEDGRIVRYRSGYLSAEPYHLIFSPDGTRAAVEYVHSLGYNAFFVVILNGDPVPSGYVDYMPRYFGAYQKGSLRWIDENNLEGINSGGWFTLNLYEGIPVSMPDHPEVTDPEVSALLSMTVSECTDAYGPLELLYSEHGPCQPVYAMSRFPGVLLVFSGQQMNEPLPASATPSELIVNSDYSGSIHGIRIGDRAENLVSVPWSDAQYWLIEGIVALSAEFPDETVTCLINGREEFRLPAEDTASQYDWDLWAEAFLENPAGTIDVLRIRSAG